jgi:hypothetical protein
MTANGQIAPAIDPVSFNLTDLPSSQALFRAKTAKIPEKCWF